MQPLQKNDQGKAVKELQSLLNQRGFALKVDGDFGTKTFNAVRAFQVQNLDQHGQPLVVDGRVGALTWWSLTHAKPLLDIPAAIDFTKMPATAAGGSASGRAALRAALKELTLGAGEVGGNNRGPWVKKYHNGLASPGDAWCAAFVSWCYTHAPGGIPYHYSVGARDVLRQFKQNAWATPPESGYEPVPGDIVVWWRVRADGWQGHIGLVQQLKDGMLYTIEGNRSAKVQGFSYVFTRMEKLLGFGHVP
jgi:hypothetical protein